jgi:hypothetical protein
MPRQNQTGKRDKPVELRGAVSETTTTVSDNVSVPSDGTESVVLPRHVDVKTYEVVMPIVLLSASASESGSTEPNGNTIQEAEHITNNTREADISDAAISRLGGGAALGTVIGTAINPGIGTAVGVVLGGIAGAFAPNILSRARKGKRNSSKEPTRVQ